MINNQLINILSALSDKYIKYSIGGSKRNPYIFNPKDYDLIILCEDYEQYKNCYIQFNNIFNKKDIYEKYLIDVIITDYTYPLFLYFYLFEDKIGEDIQDNIPNNLQEIISFKDFINHKSDINMSFNSIFRFIKKKYKNIYQCKSWYHIYMNLCLFENNKPELNEEQVNNLNILHDVKEEDLEKRKILIDEMIEKLNLK